MNTGGNIQSVFRNVRFRFWNQNKWAWSNQYSRVAGYCRQALEEQCFVERVMQNEPWFETTRSEALKPRTDVWK